MIELFSHKKEQMYDLELAIQDKMKLLSKMKFFFGSIFQNCGGIWY
jgi:hypothetical protein